MSMSDDVLQGYEALSPRNTRGQVYMVTHKGEQRLPFMNRSFISFSFGAQVDADGKEKPVCIEDFGLIATIENNRLQRAGSAEFEDLVDQYNILDGQFYWGTHYRPNKITFKLATDGMTQQQLDNFKNWFAGGKTRELILAEHPNRAILARVSNPPNITMLPFAEPAEITINGNIYQTTTTMYKGEITLEFVMDLPFWYSKINIFGHYDSTKQEYVDTWIDANGQEINIFDQYKNFDVLKVILEDNIPTSNMISISTLLGNNTFANTQTDSGGHIAFNTKFVYMFQTYGTTSESGEEEVLQIGIFLGEIEDGMQPSYIEGESTEEDERGIDYLYPTENDEFTIGRSWANAVVTLLNNELPDEQKVPVGTNKVKTLYPKVLEIFTNLSNNDTPSAENPPLLTMPDENPDHCIFDPRIGEGARIYGPYMAENTGVENLNSGSIVYFYYAGTAPSYPEIQFKLTPMFDENGYINSPCNSYASSLLSRVAYNTITIESLNKREFKFTTPNIYTAFNEVIKILNELSKYSEQSWEEVRKLIRDNVKHYAVRVWANHLIDDVERPNGGDPVLIEASEGQGLIQKMRLMFKEIVIVPEPEPEPELESEPSGEEEEEQGQEEPETPVVEPVEEYNFIPTKVIFTFNSKTGEATGQFRYRQPSAQSEQGIMVDAEEDVGDMIKSDYLIITDRNHFDEQGYVVARTEISDYTKTYTHTLKHDVVNGLENIYLRYNNMYL